VLYNIFQITYICEFQNFEGLIIVLKYIFSRNEPLSSPTKRNEVESRNYPQQQQQQQQNNIEIQTLRDDLRDKSARLEAALSEKNQLSRKLKSLEQRDVTDHSKKVKTIHSTFSGILPC
jgi:hypothetical protein